MITQTYIHH